MNIKVFVIEAEIQFKAKSTAAATIAERGVGSMGQGRGNLRGARRGGSGQGGRGREVPPEGSYYGGCIIS